MFVMPSVTFKLFLTEFTSVVCLLFKLLVHALKVTLYYSDNTVNIIQINLSFICICYQSSCENLVKRHLSFWKRVLVVYRSRWSCNNDVISFKQISQNSIVTSEFSCCPCLVTTVFIDMDLQRALKVSWSLHNYVTCTVQINLNAFDALYISCCPNVVTIALERCFLLILLFKFDEHNPYWKRDMLMSEIDQRLLLIVSKFGDI